MVSRQQQLAIAFPPSWRAEERWPAILAQLQAAIDRLGRKEVVYACGTDRNSLDDALHERERKSPRLRWLAVVLELAATAKDASAIAAVRALVAELADAIDCDVVQRTRLTPEQMLERLRAELEDEFGHKKAEQVMKRAGARR